MLKNISEKDYKNYFPFTPNPFISEEFTNLTKHKVDKVVRLIDSNNKDVAVGLVAGIKNNELLAPFSAPFGGFHFRYEAIFYDRILDFLLKLKKYLEDQNLESLKITLSPEIYNPSINAKFINAFLRLGFAMDPPDILSYIDLKAFDGKWIKSEVQQNYNRAVRNGLTFGQVADESSIKEAYNIVVSNRKKQNRPIHMSLNDLIEVNKIIPVDFFLVRNYRGDGVSSGVFYRGHEKIIHGVFVGDVLSARKLGAVDFMFSNLFNHYKEMGYDFIDLGKSSLEGEPNIGLIRFKEIHNCTSSLLYTFSWDNVKH